MLSKLNPKRSGIILLMGFGGLIVLMTFAGVDALRMLRSTETRNEEIRRAFLERNRVLNEIRSDLYLSGTYARDYLLDPRPANAETYRTELERIRQEVGLRLAGYAHLLDPVERQPFDDLNQRVEEYWRVLDPVFQWTPEQRRKEGFDFLRNQVLPRRMTLLGFADQIQELNEQQMDAGAQQVEQLFSEFRTRLGTSLAVTFILGVLLALFSSRRILALEHVDAIRYKEVTEARGQLQNLSARLVDAQEQERRALSRELHDEVGQALSAMLVGLSNLSAAIRSSAREQMESEVAQLRRLVESTVKVVRNITLLLRPSMLDDLGLVPALEWQAREVSRQTGLLVNVAAEAVADDLPEEYRTCIYRVVQEALHNVARHAVAGAVRIVAHQEPQRLVLTIQDDGRGFDAQRSRGLGMLGMEERVVHLGGTFRVTSAPGSGTLISVVLPLAPETPQKETPQKEATPAA
jgi:signal transduction histidine kinase